jgi:recombinational DNA repair ATPase RecF
MNPELLRIVERRLEASEDTGARWAAIVLGACEGQAALDAVLGGGAAAARDVRGAVDAAASDRPRGAYLESITVEGFRGIGPRRTLDVELGPGLTLVVGRNGSGKSSFAEAVELLLTGTNSRWARRSKIWQEGWRNLHHPTPTGVAAAFAIDGVKGETIVTRQWADGAGLNDSTAAVRRPGDAGRAPLDSLGWTSAVETFRPFLSYNELGATFDEGPTEFHDRLSRILGLGEIEDAQALVRSARRDVQATVDDVKQRLPPLLAQLDSINDPRATAAAAALRRRPSDLNAAERAVTRQDIGSADVATADEVNVLRFLANVQPPSTDEVRRLAGQLEALAEREAAVAGTPAGEARDTIDLLRAALHHFDTHGEGDCPVCGKKLALLPSWRARTEDRIRELSQKASAAEAVAREARSAREGLARLRVGPPAQLAAASERVGLDAAPVIAAWRRFAAVPDDPSAVPSHLFETIEPLALAVDAFRTKARDDLERRESRWAPVARQLTTWLELARAAAGAADEVRELKQAEAWLKETSGEIRAERFEPIANEAIDLWKLLRQQSSVELERVMLAGQGTSRRVDLKVNIDGVESAALGVMSQGELHAMALSLFLPRATLPDSPFRFVVIDDPVQSMDPARVDGLARVLEEVAKTRQVIVFTHDDRLPESTRRLGIDARVIEVTRRENSEVELTTTVDPSERNLDDAEAIAADAAVPAEVARQVVPGYCRAAIEAAAIEIVRRRRIGRGEPHASVEELLETNAQLRPLLALALFDNAGKGAEVRQKVAPWGIWANEVLGEVTSGSHEGAGVMPLDALVTSSRRFCMKLREVAR